jgi:hypothetical protein
VKEQLTGWAVGVGSGVGAALAGAPWWAVLLAVAVVLGSTYRMAWLLSKNPRVRRFKILFVSVEASEPEGSRWRPRSGGKVRRT